MRQFKIKAICSVPRLGWNDHFGSIFDTLKPFNIPLSWYSGAFWEKCIQTALEDCVEQGVDWILTLDYDTLTTPNQLQHMFKVFGSNPRMHALAANQPRRNTGMPLMTVKDDKGKFKNRIEIKGPIQAHTAHFGLTLLRASALKRMRKPWFFGQPAKDGTYRKGAIDADIYFWKKWEQSGNTLYVEPRVCIGHMEAMVSIFEYVKNPQTREVELCQKYLSVQDWRNKYMPRFGKQCELEEKETR